MSHMQSLRGLPPLSREERLERDEVLNAARMLVFAASGALSTLLCAIFAVIAGGGVLTAILALWSGNILGYLLVAFLFALQTSHDGETDANHI